jgi:hypothetical protein
MTTLRREMAAGAKGDGLETVPPPDPVVADHPGDLACK